GGSVDPRAVRRRREAPRGRALERLHGGREAVAGGEAAAVRDRRARQRRAVALDARARARVGHAAPRARRRGHLRPRQRRADPPRRQGPALARGQAAGRVRDRAAAGLIAAVVSGAPSTLWALARGRDPLEATRAAGSIVAPHAD